MVSDGSTDRVQGSFGYILAASKEHIFIRGTGHTVGISPSSFRAEAYGALACFRFLYRYMLFHKLADTKLSIRIQYYCDNDSLIKTLRSLLAAPTLFPKDMTRSDYDLIVSILRTIRDIALPVFFHHVKGHQDHQPRPHLSWEANLNILCDAMASSSLQTATPHPLVTPTPLCPLQLIINDAAVTSHYRSRLAQATSQPALKAYLIRKHAWSSVVFDSIHWKAHEKAMASFSISHKPFICKLIHDHLPLGKRVATWSADRPSLCPSCAFPEEDFQHFLTCPQRLPWLLEQLNKFAKQLDKWQTAPNIKWLMMRYLRQIFLAQAVGTS